MSCVPEEEFHSLKEYDIILSQQADIENSINLVNYKIKDALMKELPKKQLEEVKEVEENKYIFNSSNNSIDKLNYMSADWINK